MSLRMLSRFSSTLNDSILLPLLISTRCCDLGFSKMLVYSMECLKIIYRMQKT